jgi:hypothetical protein
MDHAAISEMEGQWAGDCKNNALAPRLKVAAFSVRMRTVLAVCRRDNEKQKARHKRSAT